MGNFNIRYLEKRVIDRMLKAKRRLTSSTEIKLFKKNDNQINEPA